MSSADKSPGVLWIVATPIGTLGDLSVRAREVLAVVDLVLAEDTRRARRLLSHLGVDAAGRVRSLHEHNEERQVPKLLAALVGGKSLALISDAGTPVVSDPGFQLVRAVRREELPVCSVPGPSSFVAALAAAGQPPLPAILCGFLPARGGPRRRRIAEFADCPWTLVVLLSPHRLKREIGDLAVELGGDREATLLAEISKKFERARIGTLDELVDSDEAANPRGEYVLVVAPPRTEAVRPEINGETVRAEYELAIADGLARPDAMRRAARRLGLRRREVFAVLSGGEPGDERESPSSGS